MTSVATVTDIGSLQMMNTPLLFELIAPAVKYLQAAKVA